MEIPINKNEDITIDTTTYTYLALGDSYTIGTSIDTDNNYPTQLIDSLETRHFIATDTDLLATNGWTTTNLLSALDNAPFQNKKYDLVTLLIGVNNQYQNKPFELFDTEFRALLDIAIEFADDNAEKVIVLSIPDYSVTPFVVSSNKPSVALAIQQYNTRKKEIAESKGVTFIDITPISQTATADNNLLATDNLHPSSKMYSLWVNEMIVVAIMKLI